MTHVSLPAKAAAKRKKDQLREMFRRSLSSNIEQRPSFDIGPFEKLQIACESHEYMEKMNSEKDVILSGLMRSGMLAWRPLPSQDKLVRCDEQPWAQCMSQGDHRMPFR